MSEQIGIDLGYANIKIVWKGGEKQFPSIVGTPEESAFSALGEAGSFSIEIENKLYNVGEVAIEQSRFVSRHETRSWFESTEYLVLFHAALATILSAAADVQIVTGLPVAYYKADKDALKDRLQGVHHIKYNGKDVFTINVSKCTVIPQVMGTLMSEVFSGEGKIANGKLATGHVGVIDVGGKTTNILHSHNMGDIDPETVSITMGGWDAVRALHPVIEDKCPDVGYADHEVSQAIVNGHIKYRGEQVDLSNEISGILTPMASEIIAKANEIWDGGGAKLDAILISGGGANLLGEQILNQLQHANISIVDNPVFANAAGFYKFALYIE